MAAKSANLYVRIEPEIKEKAESILHELGISAAGAVNMLYRQIIIQNGLPFEVKAPVKKPLCMDDLTPEQLDAEIEKGYAALREGRTIPMEEAFDIIRREYSI